MKKYLTRDEIHQMLKEDREDLQEKRKRIQQENIRLARKIKRQKQMCFYFGEDC